MGAEVIAAVPSAALFRNDLLEFWLSDFFMEIRKIEIGNN
jgi:hypothetical protein